MDQLSDEARNKKTKFKTYNLMIKTTMFIYIKYIHIYINDKYETIT